MSYLVERLNYPVSSEVKKQILQVYGSGHNINSELLYEWIFESKYFEIGKIVTFTVKHRESDTVVGFGSVFLREDHGLCIGVLGNFIVEEKHRTLGPAINLQKTLSKYVFKNNICHILLAYPNNKSEMIIKRLRFEKVVASFRYGLIFNPFYFLKKNNSLVNSIAGIFQYIVYIWLIILRINFHVKTGKCIKNSYSIFNNVSINPGVFSMHESWRYFECPNHKYHYFTEKDKSLTDSKMIIFYIEDQSLFIDRIRNISNDEFNSILVELLFQVLNSFEVKSINIIATESASFFMQLRDFGFIDRKDPKKYLYLLSPDELKHTEHDVKKNIFPILDGDLDI